MPSAIHGGASFEDVAWALALLAGGRSLLALMPVGDAGNRSPFGLVGSLAPSALAAVAVAVLCGAVSGSDGLAPFAPLTSWVFAGALLIALAARALGPAGLVPRHPRVETALPRAVRLASSLVVVATLAASVFVRGDLIFALLAAASFEAGCERVAAAPRTRRTLAALVLLGAALALVTTDADGSGLALALGGGAHGAGFVRRADRRDLALAMLAATAAGVHTRELWGATLVAAIVSAAARMRLALAPALVALLALGASVLLDGDAGITVTIDVATGSAFALSFLLVTAGRGFEPKNA